MKISLQYRNGGSKTFPRAAARYEQEIMFPQVDANPGQRFNITTSEAHGPRLTLGCSIVEARHIGYSLLAWAAAHDEKLPPF